MFDFQYVANKIGSTLCLFLILNVLGLSLGHQAVAEEKATKANVDNLDAGLPIHRRNGGSRGLQNNCIANSKNQNLMALVPDDFVAKNDIDNPSLFFYVPKTNNQTILEFVLRNEQDELIYDAFFTTTGDGIISIEVPDNINLPLLMNNQSYHWYLSLICDRQQRSQDLVVEGWLRQESVDLEAQSQISHGSLVQQAEVYNNQGFWYSALSVLAEDPDLMTEHAIVHQKWTEMLKSVGLESLATESFINKQVIEAEPYDL
ncbi:MAG: DUF928 domain-containing protein [Cyanobacteria bacterium J06621_8]